MNNKLLVELLNKIPHLIDAGCFDDAFLSSKKALSALEKIDKNDFYYTLMFNLAGFFVDVGGMAGNDEACVIGLDIFEKHRDEFIEKFKTNYLYNFANAKSNFLKKNKKLLAANFSNAKDFVDVKNIYWQAVKAFKEEKESLSLECMVNLANSLRSQYRFVEALKYYDEVNSTGEDIPQAWVNRSELLISINHLTKSLSVRMIREIKRGYENAALSKNIPPDWKPYYQFCAKNAQKQIENFYTDDLLESDVEDDIETQNEFEQHSDYRKWCLNSHLSLSEHAFYCKCIASGRDDLTILENVIGNNSIASMEMVLNRLKSEFSFARYVYFESLNNNLSSTEDHEACFSELMNDEILGINVERIRTSFRICFGILDKIAVALCDLFGIQKEKGEMIAFQNFWNRSSDRINFFESLNNDGVLALYSIATDLNTRAGQEGEWSFYKKWRNSLEHDFIVIYKGDKPLDVLGSFRGFKKDIILISENDFWESLAHVLQLTRSAIFSFVYAVRQNAEKDSEIKDLLGQIVVQKKDFLLER